MGRIYQNGAGISIKDCGLCKELQKIWNSYGESALEFEILNVLTQKEGHKTSPDEELNVLSEMWIRQLEKNKGLYCVPLKKWNIIVSTLELL